MYEVKPKFTDRLMHAWNAFNARNVREPEYAYSNKPDRVVLSGTNKKSVMAMLYNRIANDVAALDFRHILIDPKNGRYKEDVEDALNDRLTFEANIDQSARMFIKDVVMSLCDEGCVAIIPTETDINPETGTYDILSWRCGQIVTWYPDSVKVRAYDERVGYQRDVIVRKRDCAIIENPFYAIMNEPNSAVQRLIRKQALADKVDEANSSGKLDLIIQLPYTVRSEARLEQAKARLKNITDQLAGSQYGIAYVDATEHITQLNRAVENTLNDQVEVLLDQVYAQLGFSKEVFDNTAEEQQIINYYNTTVEPFAAAIVDGVYRAFISKNARTRGHRVKTFRDPFKLVPAEKIADIADRLTRNEIATSNEMRSIMGWKPVTDDPRADQLINKNLRGVDDGFAGQPQGQQPKGVQK